MQTSSSSCCSPRARKAASDEPLPRASRLRDDGAMRTALKVIGALVLSVASLIGWLAYRAHDAKTSVHTFCASVSVGQPSAGVAARARALGLEVHELPAQQEPTESTLLCIKGVMLA